MKQLLYGVAYYYEYLPYDRLDKDVEMMKAAGINVVRIAESTWSTYEKQEGQFDFSTVTKVLDAMEKAGISVIIGTPTYAVPSWLVKKDPSVLATTHDGPGIYGARQIMDITNPTYLKYSERIIRKLLEVCAHHKCVIGYQVDNETKYYDTAGTNVQAAFVEYLKEKFQGSTDAMNAAFGLDYWSNRVDNWEDFPDVRGTINGSLGAEFDKFRRGLVTKFLSWQADIIKEYKRPEQFITNNLDFEWRGYSFGMQPANNHFEIARKALTIAGCDIYHKTQDELTGAEIAFGGDLTRSLKQKNYLVLETEAQGYPGWTPYPGQLRLQAFSHIASGAAMVEYWHWHSIHNAIETYWRGVLGHDFAENDVYREAKTIGRDFSALSPALCNLKKENKVAVVVSNDALSGLEWFRIDTTAAGTGTNGYNDVLRWVYDALYKMNVEVDFIEPSCTYMDNYQMIIVPALYAAAETDLQRMKAYVEKGGYLIATFKTAYTDENVKVYHDSFPHILSECLGVAYSQFTFPKNVGFSAEKGEQAELFMELLKPQGADVLVSYDHFAWNGYAAVTRNHYGKGTAEYIGCKTSEAYLQKILKDALEDAGIWQSYNEQKFPVIIRKNVAEDGKKVWFYLNYSHEPAGAVYEGSDAEYLLNEKGTLTGEKIAPDTALTLQPWGILILKEL